MKILMTWSVWAGLISGATAFANDGQKLLCRANGKVQGLTSVVVQRTDLEGQICSISSNKKGLMTFFVSNGDVSDARILVSSKEVPLDGEYTVYLTRTETGPGQTAFALEEWFLCSPDDIEFCHGSYAKSPKLVRSEGVQCNLKLSE